MDTSQELLKIKELLRQRQEEKLEGFLPKLIETNPIEIGIYGSYARHESKATSDIDVYVLYTSMPHSIEKGELYEEAKEWGIDVLICDYETFYNTESIFCENILRDRIVIWRGGIDDETRQ
ncbi:nucleotidyltransferase family protein [Cellulosilyticum sp. I15G10I2]|uniref:nucleotidyltransferase family protein n=1 Tax=Cellulosilyticum sp. I15G10I2 TaxID=1892843 RepID=UPI00085C4A55|nr:nucleotidyltransferase domain-containing protein [Cellulosilyticum sp. I15G10I2]